MAPAFKKSRTFNENRFSRFVGMELETEPEESDWDEGDGANMTVVNRTLREQKLNWRVKHDGSLDEGGMEFVCNPLNGDKLFNQIDRICAYISGIHYGVSSRCGFHMHIDARDIKDDQLEKIFLTYYLLEGEIKKLVSKSRRGNRFCRSLRRDKQVILLIEDKENKHKDFKDYYRRHGCDGRYKSVNFTSLNKYGTIEIRLHQGTTNPEKIKNWVLLNLAIFTFAKNVSDVRSCLGKRPSIKKLNALILKELGIVQGTKVVEFFNKRRMELNGKTEDKEQCKQIQSM